MKGVSAWLLLVALTSTNARATDLRDVMTDLTITSWNQKDGLAQAIVSALAQDRDGYLWVGTSGGLFRFDGVRFSRWDTLGFAPLPSQVVRSLPPIQPIGSWRPFGIGSAGIRGSRYCAPHRRT